MSNNFPIIDLHSHWFSSSTKKFLLQKQTGTRFVEDAKELFLYRDAQDALPAQFPIGSHWFDIEARLQHLQQHHVIHQLISWPTTLEIDSSISESESRQLSRGFNQDLATLIRQYPQQFSGLAYVSTSDLVYARQQLKQAYEEQGLIGAVLPVGALSSPKSAQYLRDFFKQANQLKSHIYLHTGFAHPHIQHQLRFPNTVYFDKSQFVIETSYVFSSAVFTLLFSDFLDEFPDVTIQIAMLGGSGVFGLLWEQIRSKPERYSISSRVEQRLSQLSFDTGAAGDGIQAITAIARIIGADKLVFGSDFAPLVSVKPVIENVYSTSLSLLEQQQIFFANAATLLKTKNVHLSSIALNQGES